MNKSNFKECNDKAIAALVQNATTGSNMKVWQQYMIRFCLHFVQSLELFYVS
jgi:hypothetical protein